MNKITKKFLLAPLLVSSLILSACGSDETTPETPTDNSTAIYETADFAITPPPNWSVIEQSEFTSDMPQDIAVAFRSNIKNEIFVANANIIQRKFQENISSADLAQKTIQSSKENLIGFIENGKQTVKVKVGDESVEGVITDFDAKRFAQDPIIKFKQLNVTSGKDGFTVTAAYLPTEDESVVNAATEMLNSFRLK